MGPAPKKGKTSSQPPEQPREVELKLELAFGEAEELLKNTALVHARPLPGQGGHLRAVYYDTDDQALRQAGISLRIRQQNGRSVQTIKATPKDRRIAVDRSEWEKTVKGKLDFSMAAGTPLEHLLSDGIAKKSIKPVFTIETERQAFEVERDGAVIEMAIDRAKTLAADRSVSFSEIELELKQGNAAALFTLARDLSEAAPLRLSPLAKSERGYRLLENGPIRAYRADKIELAQEASCAEAFQVIARSCLSQMLLNEPLVRQTREPSTLHQMRVGLRRLRAAISLFKTQLLTNRESEIVRNDLREVGQKLGVARDLDVFLERLRSMDEAEREIPHLEEVERQRSDAYKDLLEELDSHHFMETVLQAAAWIEAGDWISAERPELDRARQRPIRDFAVKEMTRRFKRIRKLAKHIRDMSDEERHEFRIRIKKLRYGVEFFGSLFPSGKAKKRRKELSSILEDLQERLGELNDLAVGGSLIPSLSTLSPERTQKRWETLLDKAEATSDKLGKVEPFWI